MARPGHWAPLLLCLLQSAPAHGSFRLTPPQNVTLLSQNFEAYLMWLPGPGNPENVTYSVAYQSFPNPRRWQKVKSCERTKELVCSLTCVENQDLFNKFKGRVQAVSPSAKSPWVESKNMNYLSEVMPAPPTLVFTYKEGILIINATYQLPQCMPLMDLKYEVHFWKEGTRNKTTFRLIPYDQPVQILLQPAMSGHHCLSARTIYTSITSKYSEFSKPTCLILHAPDTSWLLPVLLPLVPVLLLVTAAGGVIRKTSGRSPCFPQAKVPQALKELLRSIWLSPRVKTLYTGSDGSAESEEEEQAEDDMDDNISFQPYIEPPAFLCEGRQIPRCSETDGTHSGGPQTLAQVEGNSAWDSLGRRRASTVNSSSWDEAGISDYVAKKGSDEGLGEDEHPVPLPAFSEDSEESPQDDLPPWATWSSSAGLNLAPWDPPVSPWTPSFCWDNSPEEETEEEDDEEESETEDSDSGHWGAKSSQRIEGVCRLLGPYMAR
ncbi:interferon lambda receptor 1 [Rhynchocyon petersi]